MPLGPDQSHLMFVAPELGSSDGLIIRMANPEHQSSIAQQKTSGIKNLRKSTYPPPADGVCMIFLCKSLSYEIKATGLRYHRL